MQGIWANRNIYKSLYTYLYLMKQKGPRNSKGAPAPPGGNNRNSMAAKPAGARASPRPASPFRRLYEVQGQAAKDILKERHGAAERVAEEMGEFFKPGKDSLGAIVSALRAHSLGYAAKMNDEEFSGFLEKTEVGIRKLIEKDETVMQALVISKLREEPNPGNMEKRIKRILEYAKETDRDRKSCRIISNMAALHVERKDYKELLMNHVESGLFSVPSLVASILEVARNGIPQKLGSRNILAIAKTAYVVFYPIAETLALPADIIEGVRKEGVENILYLEGTMGRFGTLELYDECVRHSDEVEPFAQKAEEDIMEFLGGTGKSEGALSKISRKKKEVKMISPTVDPGGQSRKKGKSGMFKKIWGKREDGEVGRDGGEYGLGDLTDVVGCTCMVNGGIRDAEQVAVSIVSKLVAKYRGRAEGYDIDKKERPTGYKSPHITFRLKVRIHKKEMWVPIDIQVRPESVQQKCLGQWSRGFKVSKDITQELVKQVQADIASISASLRRRDSEPPKAKEKVELEVEVIDEGGDKKREYPSNQKIEAQPDWKVASAVARIEYLEGRKGGANKLGFSRSVSVENMDGKSLSLFDGIPEGGIRVKIGRERLPRNVCVELKKRDLSDQWAKGMLLHTLRNMRKENDHKNNRRK
jgi:ppGpp synthetase/RelA/SpoT-type nucleotidyltranferase